jgi:hypothetical protein
MGECFDGEYRQMASDDLLGGVRHHNVPVVALPDPLEAVLAAVVALLANPGDVESKLDAADLPYQQRVFLLAVLAETVAASLHNYANAHNVTYVSTVATMASCVREHLGTSR